LHICTIAILHIFHGSRSQGFGSAPVVKPGAHGCREEGASAGSKTLVMGDFTIFHHEKIVILPDLGIKKYVFW
jgi:hypothetical protein